MVAATATALTVFAVPLSAASAQVTAGSATIADPVGDAGGGPDISAVIVTHDDNGTLTFRIAVANRTGLVLGETAIVFINIDERRDTGTSEVFGADVQFVLNGDGSFLMRRWDESTLSFAQSPSASLSAGWSEGYRFSIALVELKAPRRLEFAAGTRATAGEKDQLNGRYDTQTGDGSAFDPFLDPPLGGPPPATNPPAFPTPPAAPRAVGASRERPDGVLIEWKPSAGASKYEVWRSGTQSGRGLRVGTTTRTTFLDKLGTRGVRYYYAARAGNSAGWSALSHKVLGTRR